MSKMIQEARTPLYEGCPTNRLAAILLLMNTLTTHGVSNTFVDELFIMLKSDLFPKDKSQLMYQAKRVGLSYNSICACYNGCLV